MLEMRPDCETCGCDLPPESADALICSFECTFCTGHGLTSCPNCGGELRPRPARAPDMAARYPASTDRKFRK